MQIKTQIFLNFLKLIYSNSFILTTNKDSKLS